jgi:hypothetical protein
VAVLKLNPTDRYAEIDLAEDSEVDAAELAAWEARGNAIRRCGFRLEVTGRIVVAGPRRGYRRGDVAAGRARYARARGR